MDIIPTRDQVPQVSRAPRALGPRAGAQAFRAPAGATAGITGKDIFRILRKRVWLIIITMLLVWGVTFVVTLLWWLYAPMYTAIAFLEVSAPKRGQLVPGPGLYPKDIMDRMVMTQAKIVKSEPILIEAAETPQIRATKWFNIDPEDVIRRLDEEVRVRPIPNTTFIEVSMTGRAATPGEKTDLAQIVNAIARTFEKDSRKSLSEDRRREISELLEERNSMEAELNRIRRDAGAARKEAAIPGLDQRRNALDIELAILTKDKKELQNQQREARAAAEALERQKEEGTVASSPQVFQYVEMDPILRNLQSSLMNLEIRKQNLERKFGPRHREVQAVEATLESIGVQTEQRRNTVLERAVGFILGGTQSQLDSITSQLLEIQEEINKLNASMRDLDVNTRRLQELGKDEERLEKRIGTIDDALITYRLLERGEQQIRLRQIATAPREISMPKWSLMMPLGGLLGLAVGLAMAFLLEFVDTSIKSPSDVSRRVDLPLLGMVPHADDMEEEIEDLRLAFMTHPSSLFGEAFRQIRTCLLFSGPASQRRSLLITSSMPEDGRTTVAMNLAAGIAQSGRKVLVVDANFRQPAIRTLFPDCPEGGLSSTLVGQADWRELVHEVQPNLHVMPAGMLPPNPAELLGSDEMRKRIAEMVEQYDQVLLDGAPCLVVTDSPVLSTLVDGVILVVRAGANTYGIVQRSRDILLRVGAHIVGVTLNGVRVVAGGYLRKSYETFYDYHEQAQLPA